MIITRPREALGFYEYFVRSRTFFRKFRETRESHRFQRALRNISKGENPSGWVLTRPSPKDKGIEVAPFAASNFIRWGADLYYFPNATVRDEWLNYHW